MLLLSEESNHIKPLAQFFCHRWTRTRSDYLVLSSFVYRHTSQTLFLPTDSIPLWFLFSFDVYFCSCLSYLPPPAPAPLREQWECFPRAPSVAPRFSVARAQNWLEILAALEDGWNFKEDVLANLASSATFPPTGNPHPTPGWHCFNWEHWGPGDLPALLPSLPLHRFQLQTLTPGGISCKSHGSVFSCLLRLSSPAWFCLSYLSLSQYLSFPHVSLIILPVFIGSDLTSHYKKKGKV